MCVYLYGSTCSVVKLMDTLKVICKEMSCILDTFIFQWTKLQN